MNDGTPKLRKPPPVPSDDASPPRRLVPPPIPPEALQVPPPPIPPEALQTLPPGSPAPPPPIPPEALQTLPPGLSAPPAPPAPPPTPALKAALRPAPRSRPRAGSGPATAVDPVATATFETVLSTQELIAVGTTTDVRQPEQLSEADEELFSVLRTNLERELRYATEDRRRRATLLFELAHLEELVFHEAPEHVLARYEEAFQSDKTFVPAMRALQRYYGERGRYRDVLQVIDAEIAVTADERLRAELLVQRGELLANRLADTEQAIKSLRAALHSVPQHRRGADLLSEIHAQFGQWDQVVDVLRSTANVTAEVEERARLLVEMAELTEHRLGKPAEAEELYRQALEFDPKSEAAAVALRRIYLARGRWKDLRDLLAREAGRVREPEERFADLYRAARISELHLQDDVQAAALLETAAALRPGDPLALQALTAVCQRTGRYEDEAAALGQQLRLVRDPSERATLCYRLGRVDEDWLGRPEDAVHAYREALKSQPGHEAALRALAWLYENLGSWQELLDLELLRAERARDVARRADGYVRAARIAEQQLGDLRRAVDLYDRAYRAVPGLPEAFRALERIYRHSSRFDVLAELYEREAAITRDSALAAGLLRAAARLYEEALENREHAMGVLEQLIKLRPDDREAMIQLARLYEETGRSADLKHILETWAAVTEDDRERTELRRRVGELLEGPLRRTEQAVDVYRAILEHVPTDRPTMERLKAIYERTGRWRDLVELLAAELKVTSVPSERAPLLQQIGQLCRDKLGETEQAQAAFHEATRSDPQYSPAAQALQELLYAGKQWGHLVELLSDSAERTRDPARAGATLCVAAELCEERLGDRARAEELYARALGLDPGNRPARQGLERIYLLSGDPRALESHYLREAEGTNSPELRLRAYLRLGALFAGIGTDEAGAVAAYESALRVIEDQPDALRSLTALCRRAGSWDRLAGLLARVAGTSADPLLAVAALREWATVVELHLAERWDPAPIYERILEVVPHDVHALATLDRLAYRCGNSEALIALAERQIEAGADHSWAAALSVRAALLCVLRSDAPRAVRMLRSGLELIPDYLPAVQMLRRLDELLEEWGEAAELLLQEGALLQTPELARAALVRAGNILLDRFGDVSRARRAFEQVFNEDPSNAAAFGRLASILSTQRQWNALVGAYQRRMEVLDPAARSNLQLELASLYRDSLRDLNGAVEVLQELLRVEPEHRAALFEVAQLCIRQRRWREAEGYLERLAAVAHGDAESARRAMLDRAQLLEEQLGEEEHALDVLHDLLAAFPGDPAALSRTLGIHKRRNDWEHAVEVLEELARSGAPAERVDYLIDLAEVYSRSFANEDRANVGLRRAAKLAVETGEGIERIVEYFERRGEFEGLAALLGEALDGLPPEGAAGSVAVRLARARILAGRLLEAREAEAEVRHALEDDPSSIAARLQLAALHLWSDDLGEATAEYTRVLDLDPFCMEAFRGLYRVHDRRGDLERAAGAAQAVCAVAGREMPEHKIAAQASAPMEAALSSAVTTPLGVQEYWSVLAHPDEPAAARELLYLTADLLPAILPQAMPPITAIPLDPDEPLGSRCLRLAQVLGVERLQCCSARGRPLGAEAAPGDPPRLLIDEAFVREAPGAEFRFAVGRALADILTRSFYLMALEAHTMEILLAGLTALFERGYGERCGAPGEVEEVARAASRVIPRRLRKALEEPARAYAAAARPLVVETWRTATRRSTERAGLLLAGDVEAAIRVLNAEHASRAVQAELLRFAVGPHLYEARRRLGLSI